MSFFEVGTRAWQPDPAEGWIASEVKEKSLDGDKVRLIFLLENGEVRSFTLFNSCNPNCSNGFNGFNNANFPQLISFFY